VIVVVVAVDVVAVPEPVVVLGLLVLAPFALGWVLLQEAVASARRRTAEIATARQGQGRKGISSITNSILAPAHALGAADRLGLRGGSAPGRPWHKTHGRRLRRDPLGPKVPDAGHGAAGGSRRHRRAYCERVNAVGTLLAAPHGSPA
jgi:hypothetical protein